MAISKGQIAKVGAGAAALGGTTAGFIVLANQHTDEIKSLTKEHTEKIKDYVTKLESSEEISETRKAVINELSKEVDELSKRLEALTIFYETTITTQSETISRLQAINDNLEETITFLENAVNEQADMISSLNEQYHELELESALQDSTYTRGVESLTYYETKKIRLRDEIDALERKKDKIINVIVLLLKGKNFKDFYEFAQALVGVAGQSITGKY